MKGTREIIELLVREFEKNPEKLRRTYPRIYSLLKRLIERPRPEKIKRSTGAAWSLSEEEIEKARRKLLEILKKKSMNVEDYKSLVVCLAKLSGNYATTEWYEKGIQKLLEWDELKDKKSFIFSRGKEDETFFLKRGLRVTMRIGWYPLKITFFPSRYREGIELLKIVGKAHETASDISIRHNEVLYGKEGMD
ncbi:hypothetical protein DRQ18_03040 [bacterium]|nr:MAG: hypothetical protein DRQ18_03040 [bacterium]